MIFLSWCIIFLLWCSIFHLDDIFYFDVAFFCLDGTFSTLMCCIFYLDKAFLCLDIAFSTFIKCHTTYLDKALLFLDVTRLCSTLIYNFNLFLENTVNTEDFLPLSSLGQSDLIKHFSSLMKHFLPSSSVTQSTIIECYSSLMVFSTLIFSTRRFSQTKSSLFCVHLFRAWKDSLPSCCQHQDISESQISVNKAWVSLWMSKTWVVKNPHADLTTINVIY